MNHQPAPGFVSSEEAKRRDLVTHAEAWDIMVPDVPVAPPMTVLFWAIANKYPRIMHENGHQEPVIPRIDSPKAFTTWMIAGARKNKRALLQRRIENNQSLLIRLQHDMEVIKAQLESDQAIVASMQNA
jgi:hypothetical protein